MQVVVTGAAGFVGSRLVARLAADGHRVTGIDDLSWGRLADLADVRRHKGFGFHRFDVTSPDLADLLVRAEPDVVVHLVPPALGVAAACVRAAVPRVVLVSSHHVYGEPAGHPVGERAALRPLDEQGAVAVAAEAHLEAAGRQHGLGWAVLRCGTVYGPGDRRGVVRCLADPLLAGLPAHLRGDGSTARDLVHVEDVVDAVLRCLGGRGDGRRLNVGTGVSTTLRELHRLLAAEVGVPDAPDFAPPVGVVARSVALEPGAARRALGWEPSVPLEAGLAQTVAWLRTRPA